MVATTPCPPNPIPLQYKKSKRMGFQNGASLGKISKEARVCWYAVGFLHEVLLGLNNQREAASAKDH